MIWKPHLTFYAYIFLVLFQTTRAYYVLVDAHDKECFFERLTAGTKLLLTFEVIEGGFLDIDVKITGPDQKEIYSGERESSGRTTFSAHMDGIYTLCFSNRMSTMTPKMVMFVMDTGEARQSADPSSAINNNNITLPQNKLEELVSELSASLNNVKREQEFMEIRERIHRSINENTNSRVVLWSCFEAFILLAMAVGQVYYLKRFFEVRRVV